MKMHNRLFVITLALMLIQTGSFGQDGHYWTQQYGTKSMLLSGSVIGGVEDLGAVYYNPGLLAVIKNPAFLLSASVYEYNVLSSADAFGAKKSVSKAEVRGVPTMAAGTFKIKRLPNHFFAYAIMNRQLSDLSTSFKDEVNKDVLPTLAGDEWFSGEMNINIKGNEQWLGLMWSHPLSKKISVGITTNYVTNSQTKGSNIELSALSATNEVAIYQYRRSFNFAESGLLWKAGAAGTFGKWDLGLTVKTPMIRISGTGAYNYQEFYSAIPGFSTKPESYTKQSGGP